MILPFNIYSSSAALFQAELTVTQWPLWNLLSEMTHGPQTNEQACITYLVVRDVRARENRVREIKVTG